MDYLTEFTHGLEALRRWLDSNIPDWKNAEVSVTLEPHHAMMMVNAVARDQKMETLDTIMAVGTMEVSQ